MDLPIIIKKGFSKMKKAITILMALLMLCSMVVFVSAAGTTYEGKGFTIEVPDGYSFDVGEEADDSIGYFISADDDNVSLEVEIFVEKHDDSMAEFEEIAEGDTVVTFAGRPAIIGYADDDNCSIITYTDNYVIGIDCEGDSEGAKAAYKIAETIKFTDVKADDETTGAAPSTDETNDKTPSADTTNQANADDNAPTNDATDYTKIIIVAIVAVAVVAVVVVVSKKKK